MSLGDLWVSSDAQLPSGAWDNGVFEFDSYGNPLNFTPENPLGALALPVGLAVAPPESVNAGR